MVPSFCIAITGRRLCRTVHFHVLPLLEMEMEMEQIHG